MITYYSNPEKRTVVAKMDLNERWDEDHNTYHEKYEDLIDYIANKVYNIYRAATWYDEDGDKSAFVAESAYNLVRGIARDVCHTYCPSAILVGKAKCSPKDEWNEEKGKEVARAHALVKYYELLGLVSQAVTDTGAFLFNYAQCRTMNADEQYEKWSTKRF